MKTRPISNWVPGIQICYQISLVTPLIARRNEKEVWNAFNWREIVFQILKIAEIPIEIKIEPLESK
jgi:hypothetical protein